MNILKITALASAACLSAYLGYKYVTADPPGYCRAQQRYIIDEEFLRVTVAIFERYMNEEWVYPNGRRMKRKDYPGWYKTVDFDPKNPNCCLVRREETHSVFNRMFGLQEVDVWLNSRTSTLPVTPTDEPNRFYFDVCGDLKESDIGLPDTAHPVITTTNY
ncbi:hypothetical protein B0F87_103133 [Methylobacter tundripaludum]|uniref:Uncharacterized protein n=1 Tax=Methylobacter tundripaludum TaxID=173365 RepID=A0A2S6HGF1_9GAMM|nr:hypothetical protein [Methylobacter tundripaludum]PPK76526.1 hypothetical protein B0F87_103133 [Methylobacter tundripaludum]